MLNEAAAAVVSFLGLFTGAFIASRAKEELKTGKQYFVLLEKIVLVAILSLLLQLYAVALLPRVLFYVAAIVLLLPQPLNTVVYPLLAAALYLSSSRPQFFFWTASLIFLYGLAAGSLAYVAAKKLPWQRLFLHHGSFLVLSVGLLLWKPL